MANNENLIPASDPRGHKLTVEEQSKGGVESGKKRRERKTYAELVSAFENSPVSTTSEQAKLKALGFQDENLTHKAEVVAGQHRAAKEGSTQAATWLRETEEGKLTERISAEVAEVKPLVDLTKRKKNGDDN